MARRTLKPTVKPQYEFPDRIACEESEKYGGLHLVRPTQWPPKSPSGEARPSQSIQCDRCGCWCIVTGDNAPEESGIEVVSPERKPVTKDKVPA